MTEIVRKRLALLMKTAVTLALLAVALRWVRLDVLVASLCQAQPGPLLVAALLLVLGGFAGAASWFCILRAHLPTMRFRDAAAYHWCGMFFNSFLPSNVGGDVVKGYLVLRGGTRNSNFGLFSDSGRHGGRPSIIAKSLEGRASSRPEEEAKFRMAGGDTPCPDGNPVTADTEPTLRAIVTSLLLDRAVNLAMLLVIGGFALLLGRCALGSVVVALGVALTVLVFASELARRYATATQKASATPAEAGWRGSARALIRETCAFVSAPRRLASLLLAAFASQVLKTWSNLFIIRALGLAIPSLSMWIVIPLFGVVSALPVSIGGLGVRELVAQAVAGPLALDNTHLVTLSLAGHALVVAVNLLGAIPLLLRRSRLETF